MQSLIDDPAKIEPMGKADPELITKRYAAYKIVTKMLAAMGMPGKGQAF
jgi:hypothetical protein